jgi:hypothetical protein
LIIQYLRTSGQPTGKEMADGEEEGKGTAR